jgi:hypothetical protein
MNLWFGDVIKSEKPLLIFLEDANNHTFCVKKVIHILFLVKIQEG